MFFCFFSWCEPQLIFTCDERGQREEAEMPSVNTNDVKWVSFQHRYLWQKGVQCGSVTSGFSSRLSAAPGTAAVPFCCGAADEIMAGICPQVACSVRAPVRRNVMSSTERKLASGQTLLRSSFG